MANMTLDVGNLLRGLGKGAHRKMSQHAYGYRHMGAPVTYWGKSLTMSEITLVPKVLDAHIFVGFITFPLGVNLANRAMQALKVYDKPKEDAVKAGIFGATALGHYFLGRGQSSYWFGALLGQFGDFARIATDALVGAVGGKATSGLGSGREVGLLTEEEIQALKKSAMTGVGSVVTDETSFERGRRNVSSMITDETEFRGQRGISSAVTEETEFERGMRGMGMDQTGYPAQMGSGMTDLVDFGRRS